MIANCGHDEKGRYIGGVAGDQTGKEWYVRSWYRYPWNCVLRYPDINVGRKIAELARKAAANDHIGYDQGQRWTFLTELIRAGYDPEKIVNNCEADCSSGVISIVKAVGYILDFPKLFEIDRYASYTGNMRNSFCFAGFQVLKDSKYLNSDKYLLPGDILLNDTHHTAINLDGAVESAPVLISDEVVSWTGVIYKGLPSLKKGDKNESVKFLQSVLINRWNISCGKYGADGDYGTATEAAVKAFQGRVLGNAYVNGVVGDKTWRALLS